MKLSQRHIRQDFLNHDFFQDFFVENASYINSPIAKIIKTNLKVITNYFLF